MTTDAYRPRRPGASRLVPLRGLRYHVLAWGEALPADAARPPIVMLHGWMDVGASFQFVVDAMAQERCVIAPDWRGFGRTESPPTDSYWFPDYLADLDALLDALLPGRPVDLVGHSMGGNVAMLYAGVRPQRVRRLVNLEGFGMPAVPPQQAPDRYGQWLDELKAPAVLRDYDSLDAVAGRLRRTNPLLTPARARWLAAQWSRRTDEGRWQLLADPAHKRVNPVLARTDEWLACWRRITAPVLWMEGDRTDILERFGTRYQREEFERRLATLPRLERQVLSPAGHMLHHDQPEALARHLERFLDAG